MAKKPCSTCGKTLYVGASSRPDPVCHECRRAAWPTVTCGTCGVEFRARPANGGPRRFCSIDCANSRPRDYAPRRPLGDRRRSRYERDQAAPGLTGHQRSRMLRRIKRAGIACAYCQKARATTIDHVVPLARGGTNYEGNLVPCCRRCNSSKADRLLIEWRLGRPAGATYDPRPWLIAPPVRVKAQPKPKPVRAKRAATCCICMTTYLTSRANQATCSRECSDERRDRNTREAYRARVGLPPTWHVPVKRHAA